MDEMSEGRRALIAVVVSLLILVVWSHFYKPPTPPPQAKTAVTAPAVAGAKQPAAPAAAEPTKEHAKEHAKEHSATASATPSAPNPVAAKAETAVTVESPLYRVQISNRGGVVRSWELKKYLDNNNHQLDLVNTAAAQQLGQWPFSAVLQDKQLSEEANSALYVISPSTTSVDAPTEVTMHWSDGHLEVTKTLKFTDSYEMQVQASASLDGRPLPVAVAWAGGFGDTTVYQEPQLITVFYDLSGKLNLLTYKKVGTPNHQDQPAQQAGPLNYAGIEDQFFTTAFLPNDGGLDLWHWMHQANEQDDGKTVQQPVAEMAAGTSAPGPLNMRVYVGPKDLDLLAKVNPPLESLVNFGWMSIIAKPLLAILQWAYHYVPNYGWCIVLMTLAINSVLFPLKMSSWRSMQKMQRVAPEIRQIQDRYKKYSMNDPRKRKMNEEVMEVYNREGVNPMGSCLPMVAQMPIWWALYRMLGGAIELRHAPWIGWVHDLSAHDPYYILPILMTLTMYLMQKMTPTTTVDPTQQKMAMYMPVIFGALFFRLSSGLILYIFTSNLVGMGQQWYLNRTNPLPKKGKGKLQKAKASTA